MMSLLKRYFQNREALFVLLFGSYAKGSATKLSDVDIAIATKKELDLLEMGMMISDLETLLDKRIDLVVLNGLSAKNPKLAFSITQNHKLIVCHDSDAYSDFKSLAMQRYFDQKPMLDMFDSAVEKRLQDGTYAKI